MRGQAYTLEGFAAALLVVGGVVFALQATAVTPLSASTSNQHIENQYRATADDLLAAAAENDTLRPAVTFWDPENNTFHNASEAGYYSNGGPPNAFGAALNETFGGSRVAFNVEVRYRSGDRVKDKRMVHMGTPSDNAAAATRTVALYDDTALSAAEGNVSAAATEGDFYASDADSGTELFNVVEVRIVVWRI